MREVGAEDTIIKCTELTCQGTFTVLGYAFSDTECTVIASVKAVPLTGRTPYYCPICGKNLGKSNKATDVSDT
jgi:hypothetical protein